MTVQELIDQLREFPGSALVGAATKDSEPPWTVHAISATEYSPYLLGRGLVIVVHETD